MLTIHSCCALQKLKYSFLLKQAEQHIPLERTHFFSIRQVSLESISYSKSLYEVDDAPAELQNFQTTLVETMEEATPYFSPIFNKEAIIFKPYTIMLISTQQLHNSMIQNAINGLLILKAMKGLT